MEVAAIRERIEEEQARCFVLDAHHLAMLDRFLARARRHAGRADLHFPGVTLEIDPTGAVSVAAAGLEPLVLAHPSAAMGDDVGLPLIPAASFSRSSRCVARGTEAESAVLIPVCEIHR